MRINQKLMGFAAGTKVLMSDGSERAIEYIKTGDFVLSFNQLDAFGKLEPKRVLNTFTRIDRNPLKVKVIDSDIELTVAPGQLFINPGSDWKDAININEIIDGDGNVHKFDVSQISRGKHQIHDIIVEDNHSLIANGVRVHNMTYTFTRRNLDARYIQSGSSSNYYIVSDYDNNSDMYQNGKDKKKRSRKNQITKPEPKIDGLQSGAKLLSSNTSTRGGLESSKASNTSTRGGLESSKASTGAGKSTTTRSSSSFCFAYNTLFKMSDGSVKPIQEIKLGDKMLIGGKVQSLIVSDGLTEDWYIYKDVKLTGAHPVLGDDGVWRKVQDTGLAELTSKNEKTYILINENHRMVTWNDVVFSDYFMVGMDNEIRAEMYYRDFDNLFRILNNEPMLSN